MTLAAELGPAPRILVVRALPGLGDLLCATPSWRALRRAFPASSLTLLGLPGAEPVVRRAGGHVERVLPFAGWPGIVESPTRDPRAITAWLASVQAQRFDLVVQQHGDGRSSNPLAVLLGGRVTVGFHRPGLWCPDPDRFPPYPDGLPEVRRHLALLAHLGIPADGEDLAFDVEPQDLREAAAFELPSPYVCLHPGASVDARRWPAPRFAEVGDALAGAGFHVVLTGGAGERPVTHAVASATRAPVSDLAGRTSLGGLAAVLRGAHLLVTNDTGVSHLAAALRVPSVVVFSASDPDRWAPLDTERHRAVVRRAPGAPRVGEEGLVPPTVDDVLAAVDAQLGLGDALAS